jgi:hypothetical protein
MSLRLYSLYLKPNGGKRWTRIGKFEFTINTAIRYYQNQLIYGDKRGELRLRPIGRSVDRKMFRFGAENSLTS